MTEEIEDYACDDNSDASYSLNSDTDETWDDGTQPCRTLLVMIVYLHYMYPQWGE